MEESELEEGEACSYNLTNDFGSSFDPDNDLSYIDHKLQNILGHFQKDFEGDFSAENLGAKFGGYGSFLPTYQRSPLWSYPKAPAKPQSSAGTRSPNILPGESQSGNAASSSLPKKANSELASSRIPKKSMKSKKPNSSSRHESATEKPGVFSKQNSLKLRIKMGADSLPAEKNAAAIYSGLGLDVSPNSVSGSEAMSGEPQGYSPLESPANILNVMTSLPVDPCQLLSPLSNDLIRFIEREKPEKGYKRTSPSRLFIESSSAMANRLEPQKGGEDPSVEKKRKMLERNNLSADTNVRSKKGLLDGNDGSVKKPTETNTSYPSATEKETASSKLFDASKETASSKLLDASKENYNGSLKGEMEVGEYKGSKALEPPHHENPKTSSAGSVRGDKKTRFGDDDASGRSRKEYKGSQAPELAKKETEASKLKSGHKEHSSRKQKSDQTEREPQSSSKFSKQKSSVVNETKMNGQAEKKEVAALKPHNGGKKAEDTYKDFFGDMEDSEEEEEPPTLEDTPEKSRVPVTESQNVGPGPSVGKLGSDPSLPKANPVVIEEHWVACDKCGQWRLLPFGPVPKLPEKWMCTMLDWLPGANYCDVPEDETTKAVYAMYQIPAPDSQAPVQSGLKPQFNQGEDNTKKKRKGFKKLDNGMVKEGSRTAETSKKSILTSARNGTMHNSHGLSDFADEERQKHKQKERGKAVDHHSDHDSRSLKMNNKRNAERESSMLAKKMKIESFLFPDEGGASDSGVPVASADKKNKTRVSSKMPKEEGGGASDTGNSNSTGGSKKRKLKESHGSPRVYREKENHERKKARVLKEGKEPSFSHGSGKSEKKNKSHSRREYGHVAATSSSSHKPRNSSHEVKSSPVESVSSSPMRKKKVESHDTDFLAASSMRRFSDGEGDGGSDRSQTRRKNKHGSRESPVLDVCDNKGSLKAKVRAEPSLDANLENGGHKDHIHRRSNDSLAKKSGKGSSSRDGPRHIEKKINDGSSPDMVVKPNIPKPYDVERVSERSNRADLTSPARPPSRGDSSRKKVEKCGTSAGNNSIQADDVTKATAQVRRRNEPSPSPLRKEVTSVQAAHGILKEAKDLKHTADRLKSSISNLEFIELYFQACLKFLHGAFLLETSSNESARQGETMIHSTSIYSSTANLCGFCAREYEKSKEMGAAALAYKCMEAGYMRVLNSSYTSANRYRNELQTSLQIVPPGESPSSSASDVDNVNNPAAVDRVGNSRCTSSPLVAGNHVISAQNRSNILRIIQFAQNVNLAMDASRKSRVALAASIENLGEDQQQGEGVLSIKSTLDYNFQDLEGLLRLVKLAMQANNR